MRERPGDDARVWLAPGKLNLMLRVTGRRADGYHELQTVFQFIDRADRLRFTLRDDGRIRRQGGIAGLAAADDLVVRAARALQGRGRPGLGVDIRVEKVLPVGGGLGGGSSDAATTLLALNRLWELGLAQQELVRLGLQLGADVPVFLYGQAAWGEGVGERLTPLALPQPLFLVIQPPCQVSTGQIFGAPELTRNSPPITIRDFLAGEHRNDCLAVVRARHPEVAVALNWLGAFGEARLTGTGACVFAEVPDRLTAGEALATLPSGYNGFVASGLNRSPVLDRLGGAAGN